MQMLDRVKDKHGLLSIFWHPFLWKKNQTRHEWKSDWNRQREWNREGGGWRKRWLDKFDKFNLCHLQSAGFHSFFFFLHKQSSKECRKQQRIARVLYDDCPSNSGFHTLVPWMNTTSLKLKGSIFAYRICMGMGLSHCKNISDYIRCHNSFMQHQHIPSCLCRYCGYAYLVTTFIV